MVPSDYFVSTQLQLWLFCCWGCGCCWPVTITQDDIQNLIEFELLNRKHEIQIHISRLQTVNTLCLSGVSWLKLSLFIEAGILGLIYLQMMHDSVSEVLSNHTVSHVLP